MLFRADKNHRPRQIRGDVVFAADQLPSAVPFNQKPFKEALKYLVWSEMPDNTLKKVLFMKRSIKATLKCTVTWMGQIPPTSGVAKKVSVLFFSHIIKPQDPTCAS